MFVSRKAALTMVLLVAAATSGMAANFRAGDLIYVPNVARLAGANNSFFKTDLFISNVSSESVEVGIAFAPSGVTDNSNVLVGSNVKEITLAAGERREIIDVLGSMFGVTDAQSASGQLIFFGCRVGTDCANAATDLRPITVTSRTYTVQGSTTCTFDPNTTPCYLPNSTFGVTVPGTPWYMTPSRDFAADGMDTVFIAGIRHSLTAGQGFRTNLAVVNTSVDHQMTLRIRAFRQNSPNSPIGSTDISLGPLEHRQRSMFGASGNIWFNTSTLGGSDFVGFVTVEQIATSVVPGGINSTPGYLAWASMIDNKTNDPTYLEPQFAKDFNAEINECVLLAKPVTRSARRRP